jgi:hypothetical protein
MSLTESHAISRLGVQLKIDNVTLPDVRSAVHPEHVLKHHCGEAETATNSRRRRRASGHEKPRNARGIT